MENIELNVLGYYANRGVSAGITTKSSATGAFSGELTSEMASSSQNQSALSAKTIAESYAIKQSELLDQIASLGSDDEKNALALQYRNGLMDQFSTAGIQASPGSSADKVLIDGVAYDILGGFKEAPASPAVTAGSLNSTGSVHTTENKPMRPVDKVVFSTARKNNHLIDKIEAATTVQERLKYVDELRETIEKALNDEGHHAYSYGSHDKLVINDILYDILLASNGVGMKTKVQMLNHGPAINHGITGPEGKTGNGGGGTNPVGAIFSHGSQLKDLMRQISSSIDYEERRQLGSQYQQQMVSSMQNAGIDASAHADPDKIVIGNAVFDVIQNLNSPGAQARLQALRFA